MNREMGGYYFMLELNIAAFVYLFGSPLERKAS